MYLLCSHKVNRRKACPRYGSWCALPRHLSNKDSLLHQLPFTSELYEYSTSGGVVITPLTHVKDLGVIISSDLTWHRHINIMVEGANKMSSWALSLFQDRSKTTMLTLYKSLIRCRLEYCCPLWNPADIGSIQTIEAVQQYFTKRSEVTSISPIMTG